MKNLFSLIFPIIYPDKSNIVASFKHLIAIAGWAITILGGYISPAFTQGTIYETNQNNNVETINYASSENPIPEGTYVANKEDFSKDFVSEDGRYFHITEKGNTIVSGNLNQNDKSSKELTDYDYSQYPLFGLNPYVPAKDSLFQTEMDWYGSGDVDGNGQIDFNDYYSDVSGTNPFYDGTYRGDTDIDGYTNANQSSPDKQIIFEYLVGIRNHINRWEFETTEEEASRLQKAIEIDPTDQINSSTSGWICSKYANQVFINFNGIYKIENSIFAENNGTNLQYDLTHNGIFRIPVRLVLTVSENGINHEINSVYLGSPTNQNSLDFYSRIFIEPQTDEFVSIGNWSLNNFANERWYGYYYSDFYQQWDYDARASVYYSFGGGTPEITFQNEKLVISWSPYSNSYHPQDVNFEFPADTSVNSAGYPDSLYVGTEVNYWDESTQTNNQSCSDVTYNLYRHWNLIAGAYDTNYVQTISIHDLTPPEFDVNENGPYNVWDNSGLPISFEKDSLSTQMPNPNVPGFYNYTITESYTGTDVCGNFATEDFITEVQDNEGPFVTSYPVPNYDTIFAPEGMSINPDSLDFYGIPAWANWEDPQNSPIINKTYEDELVGENGVYRWWLRNQNATDVTGNPSQDLVVHYVQEPKTTSTNPQKNLETLLTNAYPNPTTGILKLDYSLLKNQKVSAEIFDLSGRLIDYASEEQFEGENNLQFDMSKFSNGIYFLQVSFDGKPVSNQKVIKQ
ncbi:MAG: T9SS type A sorting domain-containing protein [Bacteroidales bacterium]|nr:T9SS type A sorting domain-containing protein [Bacteroidales bacterium]